MIYIKKKKVGQRNGLEVANIEVAVMRYISIKGRMQRRWRLQMYNDQAQDF